MTCKIGSAVVDPDKRLLFVEASCGILVHHLDTMKFKHRLGFSCSSQETIRGMCILPHDQIAIGVCTLRSDKLLVLNDKGKLVCSENANVAGMHCNHATRRLFVSGWDSIVIFDVKPGIIKRLLVIQLNGWVKHDFITYHLATDTIFLVLTGFVSNGRLGMIHLKDVTDPKMRVSPVPWQGTCDLDGDRMSLAHGPYIYIVAGSGCMVFDHISHQCISEQSMNGERILNACLDESTEQIWVLTRDRMY